VGWKAAEAKKRGVRLGYGTRLDKEGRRFGLRPG
jgi:hypothetical protein